MGIADLQAGDRLHERAWRVIPGGVNSGQRQLEGIENLVIVGAEGATFTDADGRRYVDYHAAFGPQILGHCDPDIDEAVSSVARRVDVPGVGVTDLEVELAEKLVELVPSMDKVLLTTSGSEATFHAVRLARAVTGRRYLLKFQGCYHGWHDSVAMNVISPPGRVGGRDPLSAGILPDALTATIVCRFNDEEDVRLAFDQFGKDVAAIILEPIPHNVGALLPKPGFLSFLRRICDEFGAVLIFDEVITGFRHGLGGFEEVADVRPDLATRGKAMGNGYPIGALGGRGDLMDRFSSRPGGDVLFAGTFNGHPAMVAAALAVIGKMQREPVLEHIFRLGDRLRQELREVFQRIGIPAYVTGYGSVFCTYFLEGAVTSYDDLLRNDAEMYVAYRLHNLERGIFELPMNLKRSHISYAHTDRHIDELVQATDHAVRRVLDTRR